MIVYLAIFFLALLIGMPVALGLGMASLVYLLIEGHGHLLIAHHLLQQIAQMLVQDGLEFGHVRLTRALLG